MLDFYKTPAGHKFFVTTLPDLIEMLTKVGNELARANELKEVELLHQGCEVPRKKD